MSDTRATRLASALRDAITERDAYRAERDRIAAALREVETEGVKSARSPYPRIAAMVRIARAALVEQVEEER